MNDTELLAFEGTLERAEQLLRECPALTEAEGADLRNAFQTISSIHEETSRLQRGAYIGVLDCRIKEFGRKVSFYASIDGEYWVLSRPREQG